jgi:hypothetical protein
MKSAKVLLLVLCLSIAAFGVAFSDLTTTHFDSDTEMLQYLSDTIFVSEGRIGDRGGAATFELGIGQSTGAPAQTAQYDWQNGVPEPFTLVYDDADSLVTFSLGGEVLAYHTLYRDFDAIFVRTRAVDEGASMVVNDIVLNGEAVNDQSSTAGPNGLDILLIYGVPIEEGFALEGIATLSWTGTPPSQSRLAFQVKVARSAVIGTEPASWGGIKKLQK